MKYLIVIASHLICEPIPWVNQRAPSTLIALRVQTLLLDCTCLLFSSNTVDIIIAGKVTFTLVFSMHVVQ